MSELDACEILVSDTYMEYEDGGGRRGAFSDPSKGYNAKRNKKQDGQQGRRNRHGMKFRAEISTGCCRGDGGRGHRVQEGRRRPNESQHFPRKLHQIDVVPGRWYGIALSQKEVAQTDQDRDLRSVDANGSGELEQERPKEEKK